MGKWGTGKVERQCLACKTIFNARHDRPGFFCSKSCSSSKKLQKSYKTEMNCKVCNKGFIVRRYRVNTALYCSNECRRKRMPSGENHPKWKGGISERPYKIRCLIRKLIKQYVKCKDCNGVNQLQGHHILPYSEWPELGDIKENIEILCMECHSKRHPEIGNFILKGVSNE
jgi:5-methylcytosine-specific restriction endonuclease McrA